MPFLVPDTIKPMGAYAGIYASDVWVAPNDTPLDELLAQLGAREILHSISRADYDALGTPDPAILYLIEDESVMVYGGVEYGFTESTIREWIAEAANTRFSVVDALPAAADASPTTIYLVPKLDADGNQLYDEFVLVAGAFEKIGDTRVDLTGYLTEETAAQTYFAKQQDAAEAGKAVVVGDDGALVFADFPTGTAEEVAYTNADFADLADVKAALDKLYAKVFYVKLTASLSATPAGGLFEKGAVVAGPIQFSWSYNKEVVSQTFSEGAVELADRTFTYPDNIEADKTFTVRGNDNTGTAATASVSYKFENKIYYGAAEIPAQPDTTFIKALGSSRFVSEKTKTPYTFSAMGDNDYLMWATPVAAAITGFLYSGFMSDTVEVGRCQFTNDSGYEEEYVIMRSAQPNLMNITVTV